MAQYRQADIGDQPPNPDGRYIWENLLSDNGRDIVDPQRYEAARERRAAKAESILNAKPKRPVSAMPKFISTQDAINRRVGFIVMDYG
jgi:hypothetical protein